MPYHEVYNELPSVGDSFDSVQATGKFEAFRLEIKQLLEKKKLLDIVCIRLSHSHWKVAPGEILYEQDSQYKGQKASLTMPMASDSLPEHVPTWWMYANGTYQGAEFTSDPLVIAAVRKLEEDKEVFGEFMEVAKKFGYEKLLVPGIKTPSPSDAEAVTVEYNDVEGESYVIEEKEAEKHHDTDQFTPTVWDPVTGKANVHCFNVLRCKVKKTDDLVSVEYNDVEGKSYVIEEKEAEKHHDTNQFTPTVWDPVTGKANVHCFDVLRCKVKKTNNLVAVEYNDVEGKSYVIEEKETEKHHDTNQFTPTVWDPVTGKANVHCFDVLRCKAKKTNSLVTDKK